MASRKRYKHRLFPLIENNLKEIAKERDVNVIVVIEEFKKDMQNYNKEGYQKNIEEINIKEISPKMIGYLIEFLDELIVDEKKNERINAKRQKQQEDKERAKEANEAKWNEVIQSLEGSIIEDKTSSRLAKIIEISEKIRLGTYSVELTKKEKNYVLKKLGEMESEEIKQQQEKAKELKRENEVNKIWELICKRVKCESQKGNKPEVEYWIAIRNNLFGENDGKMKKDLRISKDVKSKVSQLLDEEVYYQDVKYYTHDFAFLRDFPEVALGCSPRRGFCDKQALLKYTELREILQASWDEHGKITTLLAKEKDNATRRVLQERKTAIEKERERREKEGREI